MPDIFTQANLNREQAANGDKSEKPLAKEKPGVVTMSQSDFSGYTNDPKPKYDRKKAQAAAEGRLRLNVQDKKY